MTGKGYQRMIMRLLLSATMIMALLSRIAKEQENRQILEFLGISIGVSTLLVYLLFRIKPRWFDQKS